MVNYASTPVASLSGGERQRAYLAMVLAQDTDVILLDEPTAYLDVGSRAALYRLLHHLRDSFGKTILAVIHDLSDAVRCCDRVALLDGGKIRCEGAPHEVIPAIEDVFSVRARRFSDEDGEYTLLV